MCAFTSDLDRTRAGYSPDRLDALVWGLTELLAEPLPQRGIFGYTRQRAEARTSPLPPCANSRSGNHKTAFVVKPVDNLAFPHKTRGLNRNSPSH